MKRPDGRLQVAYKGGPLYTFAEDSKPGDMKGNGFKDVGTWHVVPVPARPASITPPPSSGGYGGSGYEIPHPAWGTSRVSGPPSSAS